MGSRMGENLRWEPESGNRLRPLEKVSTMRKAILVIAVSLLTLTNTACEPGLAWGDPQAVVVVAPQELWDQVADSVFTVLSPTIWTVREDYTFRVAYRAPDDTNS